MPSGMQAMPAKVLQPKNAPKGHAGQSGKKMCGLRPHLRYFF